MKIINKARRTTLKTACARVEYYTDTEDIKAKKYDKNRLVLFYKKRVAKKNLITGYFAVCGFENKAEYFLYSADNEEFKRILNQLKK